MFQAFVRQAYQPLSSHQQGEPETKYKGKLVHETQLNCFYIKPGGKTALYISLHANSTGVCLLGQVLHFYLNRTVCVMYEITPVAN